MLLPTHALYRSVNRFVLGKPSFDLDDVPMFFELFNSDDQNSAHSREFILQVLLAGLRAFDDYKVMKCRHVVDLLMRHTDAAGCTNGGVPGQGEPRLLCQVKWHVSHQG
eukprot:c12997_g1_i4.p2 GENE.c12997_g1_i4~~c12997_g1_i4.p2  ORF type:complete len:109 (+),score=28.58 c12997_g1_i4:467-793(+)